MGPADPNYIPVYSEAKEAYRGITNTIENGSIEDRFRLGTVGALRIYGGVEALAKFKLPRGPERLPQDIKLGLGKKAPAASLACRKGMTAYLRGVPGTGYDQFLPQDVYGHLGFFSF